jgi:hypothetical protein
MYEDLEAAIVAKLAPLETVGFEVTALPENQLEYSQRPFEQGAIKVAYAGSDFDEANSFGACLSQYEDVTIGISIQSRTLRGTIGVYALVALIRKTLQGWIPMAGFQRMIAKETKLKDAFLEHGTWTYYMMFKTRTLAVEDASETTLADALVNIQYDNTLTDESTSITENTQ